jgi:hypothetical protein
MDYNLKTDGGQFRVNHTRKNLICLLNDQFSKREKTKGYGKLGAGTNKTALTV